MNRDLHRRLAVAAIGAALLLVLGAHTDAQSSLPLVTSSTLVYQGSFRLPSGTQGSSTFDYGGFAVNYNAAHNSLFMIGFPSDEQAAEVSIPAIRTGAISSLATATFLQGFHDPVDGKLDSINPGDPNSKQIGSLFVYNNKLYINAYSTYDGAGTQVLTTFTSGTNLSTSGDAQGPFTVGSVGSAFVDGYMAEVPPEHQAALGGPVVTGNCCLSIISRTSSGPALFSVNPADIGTKNPAPATPLVYYPQDHTVNSWDVQSTFFNGTTRVRGVVLPPGTRSVLFFGRHGLGPFCYGTGADCNDPYDQYKGTHAPPYVYYVWAYDVNDLAAVKSGSKNPWDVRAYAVWQLNLPYPGNGMGEINGATIDPSTGNIYLTQAVADGSTPIVHVYRVTNATALPAPQPPTNVRIIK